MEKINKDKISDQVYKYLRNKIMLMEYQPGEHIIELKVARALDVSQSSVREALQRLEALCLIKKEPYVGCTVQQLDKRLIHQAYELRCMLECYALDILMQEDRQPVIEQLEEKAAEMAEAAARGDKEAVTQNGIRFHEILVEAADNAVLVKMWDIACAQQRIYIKPDIYGTTSAIVAFHELLLQNLRDNNVKAAKKQIEEFFSSAYEAMADCFDEMQKEAESAANS